MFKDKAHFIEELTKSIQKDIAAKAEELEKGLHLRGGAAGDAAKQAKMKEQKEKAGMHDEHERLSNALKLHPEGSEKHKKVKANLATHVAKMKAAGFDPE